MNTIEDAVKIGTKELIGDYDFLIKTLESYLKQELKNVETRIHPIFCRKPTAEELINHIFKPQN